MEVQLKARWRASILFGGFVYPGSVALQKFRPDDTSIGLIDGAVNLMANHAGSAAGAYMAPMTLLALDCVLDKGQRKLWLEDEGADKERAHYNRVVTNTAIGTGTILLGYEFLTADVRKRDFDYVDSGLVIAAAMLFWGINRSWRNNAPAPKI